MGCEQERPRRRARARYIRVARPIRGASRAPCPGRQLLYKIYADENRLRREREAALPPPPPPPITTESFIGGGTLAYGDVVVTDKGPRVFIGKGEGPPTPADFVALDSPLSPHRGNTTPYDGAFPGQRRLQSPRSGRTVLKPQER